VNTVMKVWVSRKVITSSGEQLLASQLELENRDAA
jgi:hypothetical protein